MQILYTKKESNNSASFFGVLIIDDWNNVKFGTIILLAHAADLSLDGFVEYLQTKKEPSSN